MVKRYHFGDKLLVISTILALEIFEPAVKAKSTPHLNEGMATAKGL